jgi:hypothetical protein
MGGKREVDLDWHIARLDSGSQNNRCWSTNIRKDISAMMQECF